MPKRPVGTVRIVSGQWRSRIVNVPPDITRPLLDRVKAAVFDALGSYYGTPGRMPALVVADVFAGGGTLGLEALSRGAKAAVFVESDGRALSVLRENLATLGVGNRGVVEAVDAWSAELAGVIEQYRCELVFLDPPYADARDATPNGKIARLLRSLAAKVPRIEKVMMVFHHPREIAFTASAVAPWDIDTVRHYGTTAVSFLTGPAETKTASVSPEPQA